MKRRVAYLTDSCEYGGAERYLLNLITGLNRDCWRPVLLHSDEPGLAMLLERTQAHQVQSQQVPRMSLGWAGAQHLPELVRLIRKLQPDVFHANLTWPLACKYGLLAAVLARVPVIVATAHLFVDMDYSLPTRLQLKWLSTHIDRYFSVSNALAQQLHQTFWIPREKIQVVRPSIPPDYFDRQPASPSWSRLVEMSGRSLIFTAARLHEQKGLRYLLEAAAQVPEAVFVIAGEGPQRNELQARAHALGVTDRIVFLGYRENVRNWLEICDVFVLPSLYEGLPRALLEAMAAGRAVVASAIDGNREAVMDGESGLLVSPADPYELARAIRYLLANPEYARQLGRAARARARREFSEEKIHSQVTGAYERLLERKESMIGHGVKTA